MSERPSLFERLKSARIVQVLVVYLGASWGVLQLADVLTGTAGLPSWVGAFTLLLLAVGLVVILATAWVQSLPSTTAAEEAGERPTDWQVAPADALAAIKAGRLPHLTWGRAVFGGVFALSLLFGGAGLYVLVTGGRGILGPQEAGADVAAAGIAVVPFSVTGGEDLALWREGMVDLLSTNLDGMGGFRTIDSRTVMARWREKVGTAEAPELRTALVAAAATGARYGLVGTLVGNPAGIRISAEIYDLSTGRKVTQAGQDGAPEDVIRLAGELSVALTRGMLGSSGQGSVVQSERIEALTTGSLPALRAFLEGEAEYRQSDFAGATAAFERAVELDSLFALAWFRLSESYGWLESIGSEAGGRASQRAMAMLDRLPARERMIVRAGEATRTGDDAFFPEIRGAVERYPDDPDVWFSLGDYIFHVALPLGLATVEQAADAFDRATSLDPSFGPYMVHPLEFSVARGDRADAEARLARYREVTDNDDHVARASLAIPLVMGDSAEAAAAIQASLSADLGALGDMHTGYANRTDRNDRLTDLFWANRHRAGADHQWILYLMVTEGMLARSDRLLDSLNVAASTKGLAVGFTLGLWSTGRDLPHGRTVTDAACEVPTLDGQCRMFLGWGLARSGDLAAAREVVAKFRRDGAESVVAMRRADVVEGTIALVEGRSARARELLLGPARTMGNAGVLARASLGELEMREGNVTEAVRYLDGNLRTYLRPHTLLTLGRMHDERGQTEEARRYFRSFVASTRRGDPDLPEIIEARAALERLGG